MNLARFRALMRTVTGRLARTVRRLLRAHGVPVTDAQRTALAKALHPHITRARAQAHTYGTRRLATQARAARVSVPPAPVRQYPIASVVTVLENATRVDDPGPRSRARVTVAPSEAAPEPGRARVSVRTPEPDAPQGGRARVSVRDPESDTPRRGRAKVSVRVLDEQTRRSRRATVEVTDANRHDPQVVKVVTARVEASVERHVRMASREAVTDAVKALADLREARERAIAVSTERALAARRDAIASGEYVPGQRRDAGQDRTSSDDPELPEGKRIGWARVLTGGENCAFCAMLASRGPVYTSKKTALFAGTSVDAYHDHCDCEAVLVVEGRDWVGREQYDNLERFWIESAAGASGNEAVKAFTRAWNGKVAADGIDEFVADEHFEIARPGVEASESLAGRPGRREISRGLSTIERVHELSSQPVTIRSSAESDAMAHLPRANAMYDADSREMFVRLDGPHVETTTIHEYGHHVDNVLGGGEMLSRADVQPPEMVTLLDAIDASAPVRALREGIGSEGALASDETTQRGYLLLRPELFARAYAQWIAVESRSVRAQRAIEALPDTGADQHRQWSAEEFAPIRSAMSTLMAVHWKP